MDEKILLKKYSTRRLYDTRKSRYVTLEDLTGMIKSGSQVEIIDAATKADVTAFILTQVILEEALKRSSDPTELLRAVGEPVPSE